MSKSDLKLDWNVKADVLDVLVVGAGFAGIYQLDCLRSMGFNVKLFDSGERIGGTWYWNCYPGARVDSHVPMYEFSREDLWKDWYWTQKYPGRDELGKYFEYVDEKLNLSKDIEFNARVSACEFNEKSNLWQVETTDGRLVRAKFVILSVGYSARPFLPNIPGKETFEGVSVHTAEWPQDGLDLTGKRVGVIGTGASGVQVVEQGSLKASQLTLFQRTLNVALPMRQQALDKPTQDEMKKNYPALYKKRQETTGGFDYEPRFELGADFTAEERRVFWEELWERGGASPWLGNYMDLSINEDIANEFYAFWREKTLPRIKPCLADKLAPEKPPYPFGTKRHSLEQTYYEALSRDNVTLVDVNETPIIEITRTGIRTKTDNFELDVLIFATGFDALTGSFKNIDIHGTKGRTLIEKWNDGVATYLGMASHEFPNLLFAYGPQAPTAFANGPTAAELQGQWICECLKHMHENGIDQFEATIKAENEWAEHVNSLLEGTLFHKANSWWWGANIPGKKREALNYIGGLPTYMEQCNQSKNNDYEGFELK